MNKQAVFDKVVLGIKAQGRPAYSAIGGCEYQTDDGRRCAIGMLLPETLPAASWEEVNNSGSVHINDDVRASLLASLGPHAFADDFLLSLQRAHDWYASSRGLTRWRENWRERMRTLAVAQGLDYGIVDETPWAEPNG